MNAALLPFAGVILGIVLLLLGGGAMVAGASRLAARYGVSSMVIGLTVVSVGTSAPELVVNVFGAMRGQTELAFGNVIGSNIANLALVLGVAAMLRPIEVQGRIVRREVPLLILATSVVVVFALDTYFEGRPAAIGRADAIVLFMLLLVFVHIVVQDVLNSRNTDALLNEVEKPPLADAAGSALKLWALILAGVALLFGGGELTVRNAVVLAGQAGVSTTIVGLFVVAVGTSMPELVTSALAAIRRESDLALGNVIGSNLVNLMFVLPAGAIINPNVVPDGGGVDLAQCWLITVCLIPVILLGRSHIGRMTGALFLAIYAGYVLLRLLAQ